MTIRANRFRALSKTFLWIFSLIAVYNVVVPRLQGHAVNVISSLEVAALGGMFLGVFVAASFSPSEITWDEQNIRIAGSWPKAGKFNWSQLEAWSPYGNGVFLVKFQGQQAYQISPAGFRSSDWKQFTSLLKERFARKKTWLWIGPMPIRFSKD